MNAPDRPTLLTPPAADAGGCDFSQPLPELPAFQPDDSPARRLEARYGMHYRIKRRDEDYQVRLLGHWLPLAEATAWRERLQAEEDAWNPRPGFGNSVYHELVAILPAMRRGGPVAVGDLVVHQVIEPCGTQILSTGAEIFRQAWQVGVVLAVDALGRVASLRDRSGVRGFAQTPHVLRAADIHGEAAMEYLALRESSRGEYGQLAATFDSPKAAALALAPFVQPGRMVLPALPDRSRPDPRVARRFPPEAMQAECLPDGQLGRIARVVTRPRHPLVAVEVTEIDSAVPGCQWALKRRHGLIMVRPSREDVLAGPSPTLPLEIVRGYCQVVPVAVQVR